ncbi:hypothetical protein [Turicibacter sanguinis]|uniref:hypothetical protein n=1 Tax=Turicibacter sanguinis TaxID=154288 RepID=UPI002941C788|nr:hypothetical protein [Turicibacter sanguinis]
MMKICNFCRVERLSFMKYCYECGQLLEVVEIDYDDIKFDLLDEYIMSISKLYLKARETVFSHKRICRGESHSISSQSEDLFALLLASYLKEELLYVNQQLSIVDESGFIICKSKPDVLIMKDDRALNFIDLKMDLGYNRKKFVEFCTQKNDLMKNIHRQAFRTKNGKTKEVLHGVIDKKCKYHIPVITDCNIDKKNLQTIIDTVKNLEFVEIYFLTSGKHLNNYDTDMLKGVEINYLEFKILLDNLRN